jgi:glycerate dehydrogenase
LELSSNLSKYNRSTHEGKWIKSSTFSYFPYKFSELDGKTLGIFGMGTIGKEVAKMGMAFGLNVIAYSRTPKNIDGVTFVEKEELFKKSDFLSVHCPLTPETDKMVNREFISKMKDGAFLVNTSRGGELDEEAVKEALDSGKLAGAGVDVLSVEPPVPENPLFHTKNIYITPHIAWASYDTRKRLMEILEENVKSFVGGTPVNVVNNPRM